jgi:hypothetical protein
VYGRDDETPWAGLIAPRCVKCGKDLIDVRKLADLDENPKHRFLVRRRVGKVVFEAEAAADRFEKSDGAVTFYAGPHRVASSRQLVENPVRLDRA